MGVMRFFWSGTNLKSGTHIGTDKAHTDIQLGCPGNYRQTARMIINRVTTDQLKPLEGSQTGTIMGGVATCITRLGSRLGCLCRVDCLQVTLH